MMAWEYGHLDIKSYQLNQKQKNGRHQTGYTTKVSTHIFATYSAVNHQTNNTQKRQRL